MSAIAWMAAQPDIRARVLHKQTARNRQAFVPRAPRMSKGERIAWVLAYLDAHGPTALAELRIAAGMSNQGMRAIVEEAERRKVLRLHWHSRRTGSRVSLRWGLVAALPHAHPRAVAREVERAYKAACCGGPPRGPNDDVTERRVAQIVEIVRAYGVIGVQQAAGHMHCSHGRARKYAAIAEQRGHLDYRRDGPPNKGKPTMMLYAK